ncbi:MAG: VPLPA-CTERM sorting domain-containing protein [Gammaproteobacteria bacterium]|nr:VPLPA-CTERM sorting domain-containing protein [Gammaproteobacteria bacterium]
MIKNYPQVFVLFFFLLSGTVHAALLDVDWQTSGDNLLLHDTSTNLQWLDLSVTLNQSYNEVTAQLGTGGAYDGFRFATRDEVLHLWSEANITDTNFTWVENGEWSIVKDLADRLGTSVLFDPAGIGTHALGMVEGGAPLASNERWVMELSYHYDGVRVRTSSDYYILGTDFASEHYSSFLVRPVPLPAALWLFISGLIGLYSVKKVGK